MYVDRFQGLLIIFLVAELQDALQMGEDEFEEKYEFEKPGKTQKLIFSCQYGMRASSAAQLAQEMGFNAFCYEGSWNEWCHKSK